MLGDTRAPDDYHHRLQHGGYYLKQPTPPPGRCSQRRACCCCPTKMSSSACTCLGVCVLVLGYTLLGAFTFMAVEGGFNKERESAVQSAVLGDDIRSKTVEKLWSITEDLNILYKDNWTRLAAQEVLKFQDTLVRNLRGYGSGGAAQVKPGNNGGGSLYYNHHHHRWSFSSSFLYSLTLITTIGYGSVAPRTAWGKVITIVYALVGIPLMLVYLSTVGEVLARSFRRLYGRLFCSHSANNNCKSQKNAAKAKLTNQNEFLNAKLHNNIGHEGKMHHCGEEMTKLEILDCGGENVGAGHSTLPVKHRHEEHVRVPISLCLLIIILYICGGAFLFNKLENWSFLEGSYFCFTSLGTIGFGDLVPGLYHSYQQQYQSTSSSHALEHVSIFASSAYILVGMALIAMCFSLVQDEVVILARKFGKYFGSAPARSDVCVDDVVEEGDGVAMTVVSAGNPS